MEHQNLMLDFVFVCIVQWAVHNSPKKRQESIHRNLYPFNKLVSKGKIVWEFTPNWFIDMLAFGLIKALGIFLHVKVVNHLIPFFFYCHLLFLLYGNPNNRWTLNINLSHFKSCHHSIFLFDDYHSHHFIPHLVY